MRVYRRIAMAGEVLETGHDPRVSIPPEHGRAVSVLPADQLKLLGQFAYLACFLNIARKEDNTSNMMIAHKVDDFRRGSRTMESNEEQLTKLFFKDHSTRLHPCSSLLC